MKHKPLLALLPLFLLLTACSEFSGSEPPAPVATPVPPKKTAPKKPVAKKAQPTPPVARKVAPEKGTATYALESAPNDFKVEPSLPAFRAEPLVPPVDAPAPAPSAAPAAPQAPGTAVAPAAPAPAPAPAPLSIVTEDAAIPSGTSPAVVALISESDRNRNSGELDAAVVVMERALRIDSRNPTLTYKLAQLRLKQNKPQLAEELAGKAALLAGSDLDLKRKSWLLIAESRQLQQNYQGAKEAKIKAESFFGR
ncbi:MAG: tetratricopeptide repeat protein [Methylomonas sp.]